jgi:hypothetical protein
VFERELAQSSDHAATKQKEKQKSKAQKTGNTSEIDEVFFAFLLLLLRLHFK